MELEKSHELQPGKEDTEREVHETAPQQKKQSPIWLVEPEERWLVHLIGGEMRMTPSPLTYSIGIFLSVVCKCANQKTGQQTHKQAQAHIEKERLKGSV